MKYFPIGDTTYNPDVNNQWSDEVIDTNDLNFVYQQEGKIKGDENYNEYYDFNQDGRLDNEDIEKIAQYDGAIYENDVWYTSSTKEYYYTNSSDISKYDLIGWIFPKQYLTNYKKPHLTSL